MPGCEERFQLRDVAVRPPINEEATEPPDGNNDHDPIKTQTAYCLRLLVPSWKRIPNGINVTFHRENSFTSSMYFSADTPFSFDVCAMLMKMKEHVSMGVPIYTK